MLKRTLKHTLFRKCLCAIGLMLVAISSLRSQERQQGQKYEGIDELRGLLKEIKDDLTTSKNKKLVNQSQKASSSDNSQTTNSPFSQIQQPQPSHAKIPQLPIEFERYDREMLALYAKITKNRDDELEKASKDFAKEIKLVARSTSRRKKNYEDELALLKKEYEIALEGNYEKSMRKKSQNRKISVLRSRFAKIYEKKLNELYQKPMRDLLNGYEELLEITMQINNADKQTYLALQERLGACQTAMDSTAEAKEFWQMLQPPETKKEKNREKKEKSGKTDLKEAKN